MHSETLTPSLLTHRQIAYLRAVRHLFDPKLALASVVPLVLGMAIAYADGRSIEPWIALAAIVAILCVEVGRSAIDEVSGEGRMHVDDSLSDVDLANIAWFSLASAAVIGTFIANVTRPSLLFLGAAAAAIAAAYSIKPFRLSDRGLGELAVGLVYGPCMVLGTVLMFGGEITLTAVAFSVILGLLVTNVVLVSGVEEPDRLVHVRTLAVRVGRLWTPRLLATVFAVAFGLAVICSFTGASVALMGLLLGVIPAGFAVWSSRSGEPKGSAKARVVAMIAYVAAAAGSVLMLIVMASSS